jgi:hypothetical protein
MKKLALLALLAVSTTLVGLHATADGGRNFITGLVGSEEVPGPGDPDGSGIAVITVNAGQGQVCWRIVEVKNIAPATAAHVHVGDAGVAGPVVVALSPPTSGESEGCRDVSKELAQAIKSDPRHYYVNVHNAEYPAGAIRGQLSRTP